MGILAHSDLGIIAAAANAYSRWHRAEEQLRVIAKEPDQYTEVMKTKAGNWIQNPIVGIANSARDALVRYEAELGLSPTSRTRIRIDKNAHKSLRKECCREMLNEKLGDEPCSSSEGGSRILRGYMPGSLSFQSHGRRRLSDIFDRQTNGFRQYTTAYVEMGKKNGKAKSAPGSASTGSS
jgi:P27 family predicted phage terminase small subunit